MLSQSKIEIIVPSLWRYAFWLVLLIGYLRGSIELLALIPLGALLLLTSQLKSSYAIALKVILTTAIAVISLALGFHLFDGFKPDTIYENILIGKAEIPYSLRANYDKALAGFILMGWLAHYNRYRFEAKNLITAINVSAVGIIFLFSLGIAFGQSFDPKLNTYVLTFYGVNLLFTCISEQAFFSLLIQFNLEKIFKFLRRGEYFALFLTAIVFSLAHYSPNADLSSLLLTSIAGVIYAYIYKMTKCVEITIAAHWLVNIIHITLFTYPLP